MKRLVSFIVTITLLVGCVSAREATLYTYAPFASPMSIISNTGQNRVYLDLISKSLEKKNYLMSLD
ncbi:MAG: hypothetical protein EOM67_10975, partial [Spirochaetia bacterium]|nr:hypothetical protein [Spirochaetia bacterium]